MSWMVGANGRATFPTGRLDLGHKPNYNIHTEKIENIYNNGYSGMPYGGMYDCGYGYGGGYDYGGYGYNCCDSGLSKGAKWGIALGSIAAIGGAIFSAISGGKTEKDEGAAQQNDSRTASAQPQALTKEDVEEIANRVIQSSKEKKKSEEIARTKEAAQEREQLLKEGITKNEDGTYSKITNKSGTPQKITAASPEELRKLEANIKPPAEPDDENDTNLAEEFIKHGITLNEDGTYTKVIKDKDGKEIPVTGATPEEVKQLAEDFEKIMNSNGDLLA